MSIKKTKEVVEYLENIEVSELSHKVLKNLRNLNYEVLIAAKRLDKEIQAEVLKRDIN